MLSNESAQPVSFEEWVNHVDRFNQNLIGVEGTHVSVACAKYLEPVLDGYMIEPLGSVGTQPITAVTRKTNDIREFKDYLTYLDSKVYLHMPVWIPAGYQFEPSPLLAGSEPVSPDEYPIITSPVWMIRYAIILDI